MTWTFLKKLKRKTHSTIFIQKHKQRFASIVPWWQMCRTTIWWSQSFKVDTESLPVFIPELKHPKTQDESVFLPMGEVISDYTVMAYFLRITEPRHNCTHRRYDPFNWSPLQEGYIWDEINMSTEIVLMLKNLEGDLCTLYSKQK